jgi:hypothetical protein
MGLGMVLLITLLGVMRKMCLTWLSAVHLTLLLLLVAWLGAA